MDSSLLTYIETNLLKKGEELTVPPSNDESSSLIDFPIIKRLETKIKQVGLITCSTIDFTIDEVSPSDQRLLKLTPKKKLQPSDLAESLALAWMDEGWLIREVRFKKDGRTVDAVHYRMGNRLVRFHQKVNEQNMKNIESAIAEWKNVTADRLLEKTHVSNEALRSLVDVLTALKGEESDVLMATSIPEKWQLKKKLKFLHFLTAILKISKLKAEFDWKEIGAQYYQEIGGSKEFDAYKDEFITQLEEIIQCPVATIGLISLGKITPLYFSGQITGQYSEYKYGPVHALTDLSIAQESYHSTAQTLWLVENRAILTRLAAKENFLRENRILLVCVDGHLRSSHRQCLLQLTKNSRFNQVIIWTDYDQDGQYIAEEIYQAISENFCGKVVKWITHDLQVVENWNEYEQSMERLLNKKKMEQEQILGSVEDWKRWIQLQ